MIRIAPVIFALVLGLGACRRDDSQDIPIESKPPATPDAGAGTAPPPDAQPAPPAAPAEIDITRDAAGTPAWLPHPREIVGWRRASNTAAVDLAAWPDAPNGLVDVAGAYNTRAALEVAYDSQSPGPVGIAARVILVTAASPEDAYGMFTVMCQTVPDKSVGTRAAAVAGGTGYERFCWQGLYYAHVTATGADDQAARAAVDRLLAAVVEPIPSADLPTLLTYMPAGQRIAGRTWIIRRNLGVLPEDVQSAVLNRATRETGEALGLSPETLTAIVAYDPGDGEAPNYIWLTEYPNAGHAAQAMARYKNILRVIKPAPEVMMPTPEGRYLCGTWTAGQESIPTMMILPQIQGKLPKE